MPTKPWPSALKKQDSKPKTYRDLSVETLGIAAASADEVFFLVWCWDMESERQTSVLFRATSFTERAERLAAVDSELVDLAWRDDALWVFESGIGAREGFAAVHRLIRPFAKPKTTTKLKRANTAKAFGTSGDTFYAAGSGLYALAADGTSWTPIELTKTGDLVAVAGNGTLTVAVTAYGGLIDVTQRRAITSPSTGTTTGLSVDGKGIVSIAGRDGSVQGPLDKLAPVATTSTLNDVCEFRGATYWCGEAGVFVQTGKKLVPVLGFDATCFTLVPTPTHLYVAAADDDALVLRYDGKRWECLRIAYDARASVWAAKPSRVK